MRKPPDKESQGTSLLRDDEKDAQSPAKNMRMATWLQSPPAKSTQRSSSSPAQQSERKQKKRP